MESVKEQWVRIFKQVIGRPPTAKEFQKGKESDFDFTKIKAIAGLLMEGAPVAAEEKPSSQQSKGMSLGEFVQAEAPLAEPGIKSQKGWWWTLAALVLVLVISLGAFFYFKQEKTESSVQASSSSSQKEDKKKSSSQAKASSKKVSSSESSSSSSSQAAPAQSAPVQTTAGKWTAEKDRRLANYVINDWGPRLGQQYKQYDPAHNVTTVSKVFPQMALDGSQRLLVDASQEIYMAWSVDGSNEPGKYGLVAVLSDADTQPYWEKHTYFFLIQNGEPRVLLSQQVRVEENKAFLVETKNTELRDYFYALVRE